MEIYVDQSPDRDFINNQGHDCSGDDSVAEAFVPGAFGIVVPQSDSNFLFKTQTNGHLCENRLLRGTYIPITTPIIQKGQVDPDNLQRPEEGEKGYYELLRQAQYADMAVRKGKERQKRSEVWELIETRLPFVYKDVDPPSGYPGSVPAWKWIQVVSGSSPSSTSFFDLSALSGETVVLVYPNFD